jgi:hypothetical protein
MTALSGWVGGGGSQRHPSPTIEGGLQSGGGRAVRWHRCHLDRGWLTVASSVKGDVSNDHVRQRSSKFKMERWNM